MLSVMKVFISSPIRGLDSLRDAARRATGALRQEDKRSEDFGALGPITAAGVPPRVRWADVVVLDGESVASAGQYLACPCNGGQGKEGQRDQGGGRELARACPDRSAGPGSHPRQAGRTLAASSV
jgi:hypothetical protein